MIAQGIDLRKNLYNNRLQPYLAWWGIGWNIFFILVNGFEVFFTFTASGFLTACVFPLASMPIFFDVDV